MITIANDTLPQNILSYIAFRTAFLDTMERISWTLQFETREDDRFGFLTEVPFLRSVPPHLQLDLLATTWWKHMSSEKYTATLVDEAIVYAVCETSARIAEEDPAVMQRFLQRGPMAVDMMLDHHLAAELRALHLKLSNEGDFLLIGQFSDLPPEEALRLKEKFAFDTTRAEAMFDVLGRWHIAANFTSRAEFLLDQAEIQRSFEVMQQKMTGCWQKSQ
ncbi:MAG: hypothetical protein R3C12_20820 [Planctomycetaceae bacterium]|nr:hypothetical protein [Planctomycetaceae bacterium]